MSNNTRILNLSRGYSLKHKQALRAIEQCACIWVEIGVSIRDLTLAESIAARNQQAANREPLEAPEIPGLIFKQPATAKASTFERAGLVRAANQFVTANG